MSAAPLAALTDLDVLWLDGQFSDRDALRELIGLTNFKMGYAAKIPDPSFLPQNLTRFSMNLGCPADKAAKRALVRSFLASSVAAQVLNWSFRSASDTVVMSSTSSVM
jgi:hypothetical protein